MQFCSGSSRSSSPVLPWAGPTVRDLCLSPLLEFWRFWPVVSFLSAWFVRVTTEIVVTDKRIIHKVGWIARRTEEINITKVETVDVAQGIVGRIFDFGTVLIKGIGGSWEPLRRVASPLQLRNAIIVG